LRRDEDRASARLIPYDTDLSAVEAARRDPRRFDTLYRKYVAQVYSFALYELRDPHAAEDVTARAFMNALAGLPGFRDVLLGREADGLVERRNGVPAAVTALVADSVSRDLEQPDPKAAPLALALFAEPGKTAERTHEHIGRDVLGGVVVAELVEGEAVHLGDVLPV